MFANLLTNYETLHLHDCNANSQDIRILWAENDLFQEGKCYTNNEFQQIAEKIHKQEDKFSYINNLVNNSNKVLNNKAISEESKKYSSLFENSLTAKS